jgi:site-specific recombinase
VDRKTLQAMIAQCDDMRTTWYRRGDMYNPDVKKVVRNLEDTLYRLRLLLQVC